MNYLLEIALTIDKDFYIHESRNHGHGSTVIVHYRSNLQLICCDNDFTAYWWNNKTDRMVPFNMISDEDIANDIRTCIELAKI